MIVIDFTREFEAWYRDLNDGDAAAVTRVVDLLEAMGVTLGFPHSSAINGSKLAMRELRVQSSGSPIRILYVFDPERQAVLLLGGDKAGDERWYEREVPRAERLYEEHLRQR